MIDRPRFASPSSVTDTKAITERLDHIILLLELLVQRPLPYPNEGNKGGRL